MNNKKVVVFGAAGHTGKYITRKMKSQDDIERAGIAQCMYDLICDESVGVNESLGITN